MSEPSHPPPDPDPVTPAPAPEDMPVGPPNLELGGVFFPMVRVEGDPRDVAPPGEEELDEDLPEAFREKDDVDAGQAIEEAPRVTGDPRLRLARNTALVGLIAWVVGPLAVYYAVSVLTAEPQGAHEGNPDRTWAWIWLGVGAIECALLTQYLRMALGT